MAPKVPGTRKENFLKAYVEEGRFLQKVFTCVSARYLGTLPIISMIKESFKIKSTVIAASENTVLIGATDP